MLRNSLSIPELQRDIFERVHRTALLQRTSGLAAIRIGLVDGLVAGGHAELASPLVPLGAAACERAGCS